MPGLFDALKEGTFTLFAGAQDPRTAPGTGNREGLINAGLATIASGNQDPLEAIAQGALVGRETGKAVRQEAIALEQQAALAGFVNEAGFDREGLTSVFFKVLASGDMEGARAISEILKSLPDNTASPVNRQNVSTVVSAAAGAPPEIIAALGEGAEVEVQRDPRTGQIFWESALPSQAAANPFPGGKITIPDAASPTGFSQYGVRADGSQIFMGHVAGSSGGTGGATAQINRNLATAMANAEATLSTVDETLANPIVSILGSIARQGGIIGNIANGALGAISPDGQLAMAAADQWTAATVRLLSGAQMTEVERQGYRAAYLPAGNDTEQVQRQKAAARGALAALFAGDAPPTTSDLDAVLIESGLTPVGAVPSPTPTGDESDGLAEARRRLRGG